MLLVAASPQVSTLDGPRQATLHDFILCEGDRHMGNIYIDDDNNIMLIDNDRWATAAEALIALAPH